MTDKITVGVDPHRPVFAAAVLDERGRHLGTTLRTTAQATPTRCLGPRFGDRESSWDRRQEPTTGLPGALRNSNAAPTDYGRDQITLWHRGRSPIWEPRGLLRWSWTLAVRCQPLSRNAPGSPCNFRRPQTILAR
jgi:hypothetical protein